MRQLFYLLSLLLLWHCGNESSSEETAQESVTPSPDRAGEVFGADENFASTISMKELMDRLATTDTLENVAVSGPVDAVCQAKGCWMTLSATDQEMMVKFKDYGFFVPKDIDGREVVVHGKAYYQTTSVDELRHYAEDAGKSEEEIQAINEPEKELRFLASGVLLLPGDEDADQE